MVCKQLQTFALIIIIIIIIIIIGLFATLGIHIQCMFTISAHHKAALLLFIKALATCLSVFRNMVLSNFL